MPLSRKPRGGTRSSLLSHTFPQFYACYLLKSIQTPTSKVNYIGSTPDPPRRIRQHNGELTQGAFKTRNKRPWVMQMIVYGFPSKLAALQFEWAWQHPHISRHIRDRDGKRIFARSGRHLRQNIEILRYMISNHPYNTWPLHLKIFTLGAQKIWEDVVEPRSGKGRTKLDNAFTAPSPLPRGFSVSVELEGVDGKSGLVGSGRDKPIDVKDVAFTTAYLGKNTDLASNGQFRCVICKETITDYTLDPLAHSLCPQSSCTSISHLRCLSQAFLSQLQGASMEAPMLPRGGTCPGCSTYVLWGDIVKGLYRRAAGDFSAVTEEDSDEETGEMFVSDTDEGLRIRRSSRSPSNSDGESFDFSAVDRESFSDESTSKIKLPSPIKTIAQNTPRPRVRSKAFRKRGSQSSTGEEFDFGDDHPPKRKRGRPPKPATLAIMRTPLAHTTPNRGTVSTLRSSPRKLHQTSSPRTGYNLPKYRDLYDMEATSDEISKEDGLVRSMSNLSVSSPCPSPAPAMDISD
ncbi:giy-yig catalytic domain containing protein [Moniliophthora roreri MCA 2997]|uniref:Giy-yig catalytic domain containing protein n=2 Tax=Moniliophthora roreri TaxID=221103 RepID=V2YH51_MONRO|nr:giy-yig catalytic domain containing protein [Moniliophthora roreri MCA 2997]